MATEMNNLSAAQSNTNGQMKRLVFPIPRIPTQHAGYFPGMYINRTFVYWSISSGFGLIIIGSILTYVFQEQAPYSRDPFRSSLQVTSIIFIIIGVILITSSLIKIAALVRNNSESDSNQSCFCPSDNSSDNDEKNTSLMPENTIVYNPFYPPILVPYNIGTAQFSGNEISDYLQREPNFSYLPGSLFIDENQEKKKNGVPESEPLTDPQPKGDCIFVLENHNKEAEEEQEDIVEATIEDENLKNDDENDKLTGEKENASSTRY